MRAAHNAFKLTGPEVRSRILWSTAEIAEVLGWSTRRVRRWLKRENACRLHGEHYYTSKTMLRRAFPDAADEVIANLPE